MVLEELTGPVDHVIPADRAITVRDLLTFTAGHGFPSDFSAPIIALLVDQLKQGSPQPQTVPAPQEWMRRLGTIPLLHQPGQGWTYNAGSDILGVLIARASGQSFPDFLTTRIFEPLGMVDSAFATPDGQISRMTSFYGTDSGAGPDADADAGGLVLLDGPDGQFSTEPAFPSGASGLVSTAADLLTFGRMLLAQGRSGADQVVSAALVTEMMTDHTTPAQREAGSAFLDGQGWGYGGSVDISTSNPWTVPGRAGPPRTSCRRSSKVTILLTQVALGGPIPNPAITAFLTAAAG